jgi:hypothetical protein
MAEKSVNNKNGFLPWIFGQPQFGNLNFELTSGLNYE